MPSKSGFEYMIEFVWEYLDGKSSRLDFDLDFNHYLVKHYPKMKRQNADLAEEGLDKSDNLSDMAHKKLIKKQFAKFDSVLRDGMY